MTTSDTIISLTPSQLHDCEETLVQHGELSASTFRFASGVCGLRLGNERGELVLLPSQGQQIWSARFDDRELTMSSMFDEPHPTRDFLATFGGFLLHCGVTTLGGPSPRGIDPLHGELPNAPYQSAHIIVGEDDRGPYIALGGQYRHTIAFSCNYVAEPLVKLRAGCARFHVSMRITNLKNSPMELMYLAHVNFRPVDNGRLIYSAIPTPEHVRVRVETPSHIEPAAGYAEFIEELTQHPERHHILIPDLAFDPEVCFFIDYLADQAGWAHSMQVHPSGVADYIAHRPSQLGRGTRWISRTPDQDAIALVEPGTVEPGGYDDLKANRQIKVLPSKGVFICEMEMGALSPAEAKRVAEKIDRILAGRE